jgi:cytochrome c peroxidase
MPSPSNRSSHLFIAFMSSLVACESQDDVEDVEDRSALTNEVRALAAGRGIGPLDPPPPVRAELVELGRVLAFDRLLSGNRDISCMTWLCGGFNSNGSDLVALGNRGLAPIAAPECL